MTSAYEDWFCKCGDILAEVNDQLKCITCANEIKTNVTEKKLIHKIRITFNDYSDDDVNLNQIKTEKDLNNSVLKSRNLPKIRKPCCACGNNEMFYRAFQISLNNEVPIVIFNCTKCGAEERQD